MMKKDEFVHEFIIVATDGLWDVLSSQEAVDMARAQLMTAGLAFFACDEAGGVGESTSKSELKAVADLLVSTAINRGSQDNVTATILLLERSCAQPVQIDDRPVIAPAPQGTANGRHSKSWGSGGVVERAGQRARENAGNTGVAMTSGTGTGTSTAKRMGVGVLEAVAVEENENPADANTKSSVQNHKSTAKQATEASVLDDDEMMSFLLDDANF